MDRRFVVICATFIIMLCSTVLVACDKKNSEYEGDGKISLDSSVVYITVGEKYEFIPQTIDKNGKFKWSIKNGEIAEVDDNGIVKGKAAGETQVTVKTEQGKSAMCKIIIGDSIVSQMYKDADPMPKNRYSSVSDAVKQGGKIIVMAGKYDEYVIADKAVEILAVNSVTMRGISGTDLSVTGVSFTNELPLKVNEATVTATSSLILKDCNFGVTVNAEIPKNNVGGYAVYLTEAVRKVKIFNCGFTNYRYAVYSDKNSAVIDITDNQLDKCKIGIGINVAQALGNTMASGIIQNNIYRDVYKRTEFIYNGGTYRGELDFEDNYVLTPGGGSQEGE